MTDPNEERQEREELDLDAETVRDLETDGDAAGEVKGGRPGRGGGGECSGGCPTASDC